MLTLLLSVVLAAPSDTLTFSGRSLQLEVTPPRIEAPDIDIDGRLDEAIWDEAAVLNEFTQYQPVEGIPASEDTEVRIFYSGDAIYFGIIAYDSDPESILARLGERDRSVFGDDWIRIILDTFDDQRQGYTFYVNPLGIQSDGLWIEGLRQREGRPSSVSIDFSPDFIWESDGRITNRGWVAEIRIPYVSLRFRELPVQNWGINIAREVKRRTFKQAWAPYTQNISSTLAQSGRLVGLRNLEPKRLTELNPVVTGKRIGSSQSGTFERDGFQGEMGINARYGITRNLVADATLNPDFSQVEADATRITVNERFSLFFPEKRPFFLEGSEVFQTPQQLVYTRRVVDPVGGAKLTGKVGSFSLGYLGAIDESPSSLYGETGNAAVNLLRLRRDIGAGSTAGLLYADRTMTEGGDYNRVVAGDARLTFWERYTLATQLAGSWTTRDDLDSSLKPSIFASLGRTGRILAWDVNFHSMDPGFEAQTGYLPRIGEVVSIANLSLTHHSAPGALLESVGMGFRGEVYYDHDSFWDRKGPYEGEVQLRPTLLFRGGRSVNFVLRYGYFEFPEELYSTYGTQAPSGQEIPFEVPPALKGLKAVAIMPRLRLNNSVNLNGRMFLRELPIYAEASRGLEFLVAPEITLKPSVALSLTLNQTFSRLWRRNDDSVFSTAVVTRMISQYQFSKALFARLMIQYNLEKREALIDPVTGAQILVNGDVVAPREEGTIQGQFLLQFQPSPGTIFYIGYSRLMEGDYSYGMAQKNPTEDGLFIKLSYLFRM